MVVLTAAVVFSKNVCAPAGNTAVLQMQDVCNTPETLMLEGPHGSSEEAGLEHQ